MTLNPIMQGLSLSLMGITITFAALGLLILVMYVLQWLFSPQSPESQLVDAGESGQPVSLETALPVPEDEEVAAAIAVALSYLRARSRSGLGTSMGKGSSSWWLIGQAAQQKAMPAQVHGRE